MKYAVIRRHQEKERRMTSFPLLRHQVKTVIERENHSEEFYFFLIENKTFVDYYASGAPKQGRRIKEEFILPFTQEEIETLNPHNERRVTPKPENRIWNYQNERRNHLQRNSGTVRDYQRRETSAMQ